MHASRKRYAWMETRFAKRKKLLLLNGASAIISSSDDDEDRISDLPDDILHHIFLFLPIKYIAQTSVLSKRWRHLWYSFPDLDFTTLLQASSKIKNTILADQILDLLHHKNSDVRLLRFRGFLTFSKLTSLIRHAVKHNVQQLDVEVSTSDYFNFPRSLINSVTLMALRLKSWHPGFRLPPLQIMKDGFPSLSVLSLSRAILHDQPSLLNLFTCSSFPLLKKLSLEACFGLKQLRVECPALQDLCLDSCFQLQDLQICVQKLQKLTVSSCFDAYSISTRLKIEAPMLQTMLWSYNAVTEECSLHNLSCLHEAFVGFFLLQGDLSASKIRSVYNFLNGISSCRSLTLESSCIEILSKNNQLALCPFNNLMTMEFSITVTAGFSTHNNEALATLFRSSPTVHTITIKIITGERRQWNKDLQQSPSSGYWESRMQSLQPCIHHLKVLKIHGFTDQCSNVVSMVKFLLNHSKVLQKLLLQMNLSRPRDSLLRERIKSQIMAFSRASSNAKIIFQ